MTGAAGVTAEELIRALKRRRATLPAEIGTFIALEASEELVRRGPCTVGPGNLRISEEGAVSVVGAPSSDEESSARALHATLTQLLVAAGPAPAPALMHLVEEGPIGGIWSLDQLRDELEASLVPLNRNASRRVLARLVRETAREQRPSARPGELPTFGELDTELSSLLGVDPPANDVREPEQTSQPARDRDATVRDAVETVDPSNEDVLFFEQDSSPQRASRTQARTMVDNDRSPPVQPHTTTAPGRPGQPRDLDALDAPRPSRMPSARGLWTGGLLTVLAVALVAATLALRPEVLARLREGAAPAPSEPKPPRVMHKLPAAGDLVVRVSTERAQVLRFVGHGPVSVEHLPLGVAHEFVAIAEGLAPSRVVVPADADWEKTPEGSRYEVAIQLGRPLSPKAAVDLGDTLLPADVGSPSSALGSVRIVTTPRGAKVYQLLGFAPEVKVENLALDQTQELLVYRKGHALSTRVIGPSDFTAHGGRPLADVSIELAPLPKL